jgi:uncharacterized protein (DUF4415 family)
LVQYRLTAAERARMARQPLPQPPDEALDFSDLPELSVAQLRAMIRVRTGGKPGRPPLGPAKRIPISLKVDPQVLARLKARAEARGIGYQTYMHEVLAAAVGEDRLR